MATVIFFAADLWQRLQTGNPGNALGRYYVDDQCIDCDLCRQTAPMNFTRDEERGHSFVFKQPETPEEEAQCQEAMRNCPVGAIGDDGKLVTTPVAEEAAWQRCAAGGSQPRR